MSPASGKLLEEGEEWGLGSQDLSACLRGHGHGQKGGKQVRGLLPDSGDTGGVSEGCHPPEFSGREAASGAEGRGRHWSSASPAFQPEGIRWAHWPSGPKLPAGWSYLGLAAPLRRVPGTLRMGDGWPQLLLLLSRTHALSQSLLRLDKRTEAL